MRVYASLARTPTSPRLSLRVRAIHGSRRAVIPFYPLHQVIGATPCSGTYGRDGAPDKQITFWKTISRPAGRFWNGFFNMFSFIRCSRFLLATDSPDPNRRVIASPGCLTRLTLPTRRPTSPSTSMGRCSTTGSIIKPAFPRREVHYRWPPMSPCSRWRNAHFAGGEYHTDVPTIDVPTDDAAFARCRRGLPGALAWAPAR